MLARRVNWNSISKSKKYFRNDITKVSLVECDIVSWLSVEKDLREVWKDTNEQLNIALRHYNNHQLKEGYPKFFINDEEILEMNIKNQKRIKDVQMDGYYDYNKKTFIETIYSAANEINEDEVDNDDKNIIYFYYIN
ncbi:hypothetical protein M9Y10_036775 [Tritrichomonas musculus]|uniref:Uncharacterized protein n=1 Tax=Tritrichomonas musculus TaxID=1915356 RepID=A0ABR2GUT5_9EUKA